MEIKITIEPMSNPDDIVSEDDITLLQTVLGQDMVVGKRAQYSNGSIFKHRLDLEKTTGEVIVYVWREIL